VDTRYDELESVLLLLGFIEVVIGGVIENINKYTNQKEVAFSFYVFWMCAHAYAVRQRKVLMTTNGPVGYNG